MTKDNYAQIKSGRLAQAGLLDDAAIEAAARLIEEVAGSELKTIRILLADQHGILRGKTLVAGALLSVFRNGLTIPSSLLLKDTSNRTVFPVWSADAGIAAGPMEGAGDLLLVPDPATFRRLSWSPGAAWLFCDAAFSNAVPVPFAPRRVLAKAIDDLAAHGLEMQVGLEVEFHVFALTQDALTHEDGAMPGNPPQTQLLAQGYQLLGEPVYARLEPVMEQLRAACQGLGLPLRSMEAEMGPSQFEFTFDPDGPMAHADNMMMLRAMVKQVCVAAGLHATFMSRPKVANGSASGWHLHQSLRDTRTGQHCFEPETDGVLPDIAGHWIAGLLDHAAECCLLTTPTVNGYKRYRPFQLAPDRIQWGVDNRGAMVRALMRPGDKASRIENRVAETAANPYFFFASQIFAGLSGIERKLEAPAPVEMPYDNDAQKLPDSLVAAIVAFENGSLFAERLGPEFVHWLATIKRAEWDRYLKTVSHWEQCEYFSLY